LLPLFKYIATFLPIMFQDISFIRRGKIRLQILKNLEKPKTPTDLSDELKIHRSTISRSLLLLEKKGFIKCITPNEKMGRYYEKTNLGSKILSKILSDYDSNGKTKNTRS